MADKIFGYDWAQHPNEILLVAIRAFLGDDMEGTRDYIGYYRDWRRMGGFEPKNGDVRAIWIGTLYSSRIAALRMEQTMLSELLQCSPVTDDCSPIIERLGELNVKLAPFKHA